MEKESFRNRSPRKIFFFILSVFLASIAPPDILHSQTNSEPRLDFPTADPAIVDPVPFEVINKIALAKCREKWGQGALGEPIPLCDLDGKLTAYMFSYRFRGEHFPSYEEILSGRKEGRRMKDLLKNGRHDEAREMERRVKQTHPRKEESAVVLPVASPYPQGQIAAFRPDGSKSRKWEAEELNRLKRFAARQAIGADEFGTIVVSATYGRTPVPAYFHYLAPLYFQFDLALQKARSEINQEPALERFYFLGLEGQFFEFAGPSRRVRMQAMNLEIQPEEDWQRSQNQSLQERGEKESQSPEMRRGIREKIAAEWDRIKTESGVH